MNIRESRISKSKYSFATLMRHTCYPATCRHDYSGHALNVLIKYLLVQDLVISVFGVSLAFLLHAKPVTSVDSSQRSG